MELKEFYKDLSEYTITSHNNEFDYYIFHNIFFMYITKGNLMNVKYFIENNIIRFNEFDDGSEETLSYYICLIVDNGHLDILKYFNENGYLNKNNCEEGFISAITNLNIEIINYLSEINITINNYDNIIEKIITPYGFRSLNVIDFLINKLNVPINEIKKQADKHKIKIIIDFLIKNNYIKTKDSYYKYNINIQINDITKLEKIKNIILKEELYNLIILDIEEVIDKNELKYDLTFKSNLIQDNILIELKRKLKNKKEIENVIINKTI